tara:strand:+ start:13479 stop:13670 length:192 start_codon:yes stop_codon:yes gene_type:complete
MNEEDPDFGYQINLTIEDIYLLHQCVVKRIERWEGGNPSEQEHLWYLRDWLYRVILEYRFDTL